MNAVNDTRLINFDAIPALMARIKDSGNAYPKVRLAIGEKPLVLKLAGNRSKNAGSVTLTDGGAYPASVYYGRVSPNGTFYPSRTASAMNKADKAALWAILSRMKRGEAEEVFAEYGKRFGTCCMCGRELTNAESVELGIGPVCRARAF